MGKPKIEKLMQQKAALNAAIRAVRAAQNRSERAARRREVAALVERAIRTGATAAQVQAAIDSIGARSAPQAEPQTDGEQHA